MSEKNPLEEKIYQALLERERELLPSANTPSPKDYLPAIMKEVDAFLRKMSVHQGEMNFRLEHELSEAKAELEEDAGVMQVLRNQRDRAERGLNETRDYAGRVEGERDDLKKRLDLILAVVYSHAENTSDSELLRKVSNALGDSL